MKPKYPQPRVEHRQWLFALLLACLTPLTTRATQEATPPADLNTPQPAAVTVAATPALDLSAFSTLEQLVEGLADKRVIFIGEQHTRYDHHLTQLEIIRHLHGQNPNLAIGMEAFQQPFQWALDDRCWVQRNTSSAGAWTTGSMRPYCVMPVSTACRSWP
jgi:uncharacterized iron-regulated protein